jgi:hypothetical protein
MPWYEYTALVGRNPLPLVEIRLWHGSRDARLFALVDSGADFTLLDVGHAEDIGLDRRDAVTEESIGASGLPFRTYRWPDAELELQFELERFPFVGAFVEFGDPAAGVNLVGRGDFFRRFVIQFWDAAELVNIDLSPVFPRPTP